MNNYLFIYTQSILNDNTIPVAPQQNLATLHSYIVNLSEGHFTNLNAHYGQFNNIMNALKNFPYLKNKSVVKESFNKLIEDFIKKQEAIDNKITDEISSFKEKQTKEIDLWKQEKAGLTNEINALKQENSKIQAALNKYQEKIDADETKVESLISKLKAEYEFLLEGLKNKFDEHRDNDMAELEKLIEECSSRADGLFKHMDTRKQEVEKLWKIIGKASVTGSSQNYADNAKKFADVMMWITIGLMMIVISVLSITTYLDLKNGTFEYLHLFYKAIASTVFLIPAFYCANISKRQRDREFQLRDFEVKAAALEPFMESMTMSKNEDNEEKDKVKLELTKAFFDKEFSNTNKHNDSIFISKDMIKIIRDLSKNLNLSINKDLK